MPPPPATLLEELIEEVFLRLPPDEPASIVRASLASKLCLGRLTGTAFHGRYREFHGAPPMLGFFCRRPSPYINPQEGDTGPLFLSTTKFDARIPDAQRWRYFGCYALDCRHGRILLGDNFAFPDVVTKVAVWEPMTGRWWNLGTPIMVESYGYGAAVLCAVTGCDHRACHAGPFRAVFVGLDLDPHGDIVASVWLSSPEEGECSDPSSDVDLDKWVEACSGFHIEDDPYIEPTCPVLVKDALYFILVYKDDDDRAGILKYDLSSNSLSFIDAPQEVVDTGGATILMEMQDGSLGFVSVDGLTLYLWSRQLGSDGVASWTECKVINLKELIPILNPENRLTLIGSAAGRDIVFVTTDLGSARSTSRRYSGRRYGREKKSVL